MKSIMSCLLLASCTHVSYNYTYHPNSNTTIQEIPIYIDVAFTDQNKKAILSAINQWNFALNNYLKLKVVSTNFDMEPNILTMVMNGHGWLFLKINSTSTMVHDDNGKTTLAFANEDGGNRVYFVMDRINDELVESIALHEIGHLLGASHSNHALMNANYDTQKYKCIDKDTMTEIAKHWHLNLSKVNYCYFD